MYVRLRVRGHHIRPELLNDAQTKVVLARRTETVRVRLGELGLMEQRDDLVDLFTGEILHAHLWIKIAAKLGYQ